MKATFCITAIAIALLAFCVQPVLAQTNTPPASQAEIEAFYTTSIETRTADILKFLSLTNAQSADKVHDLIIGQYRIMRARDEVINAQLKALGQEPTIENRASRLAEESKLLHDYFFKQLATVLTPDQIEIVKDKMTYNKVKVTIDAYNAIIPGLSDADKAKIAELLRSAREEAVDGGSSGEKSAIFQKYKDKINEYLNANGHDVAKAYKDWESKQPAAKTDGAEKGTNLLQK